MYLMPTTKRVPMLESTCRITFQAGDLYPFRMEKLLEAPCEYSGANREIIVEIWPQVYRP